MNRTSLFLSAGILGLMVLGVLFGMGIQQKEDPVPDEKKMKLLKDLTQEEKRVILQRGTERPYTGKYYQHREEGTYTCKRCGLPLYRSKDKFDSGCGWPSFDDEIPAAVKRTPDPDGIRTEITCSYCGAHLGHVFTGEGLTGKNIRHCVNSISMDFVPAGEPLTRNRAYFAGGCFWGVEYHLQEREGVLDVRSGYMGGEVTDPSYRQVSSGNSGHAETVEVIYDPRAVRYEDLAKLFFEIHDFTQLNRQGPDVGEQYRSEIFTTDDRQQQVARRLIEQLKDQGYDVKTRLTPAGPFYLAEDYHQDYYFKKGGAPYCHRYRKIFK